VSPVFCDPHAETVCVRVVSGLFDVSGARVFVLGVNGATLATTVTDQHGVAYLPIKYEVTPAYILAEGLTKNVAGQPWYGHDRVYIELCGGSMP